jgi:hypothetical protein
MKFEPLFSDLELYPYLMHSPTMPGPIESSVGTSDVDANDDLLKQVDRLCMEMEQLANQANAEKASAAIAAASGGFPDPKDLHSQIDVLLAEAEATQESPTGEPAPSVAVHADSSQDALLDQISNLAAQLAMETAVEHVEPEPVAHAAPVEVKPEPAVSAPLPAPMPVPAPVVIEQPKVEAAAEPMSQMHRTMGWFALNTLFLGACVWGWLIFVRQPMMQQQSSTFDFERGSVPSIAAPAEPADSAEPAKPGAEAAHGKAEPKKSQAHGGEKKSAKPAKTEAHGGGH